MPSQDSVILILNVEDSYDLINIYPSDENEFEIHIPRHTMNYSTTEDNYTISENILAFIYDLKDFEYTQYYDEMHHSKILHFERI